MEKLKAILNEWSENGMRVPFVYDPSRGEPSVTLMFFYISMWIASSIVIASSVMQLIKGELTMAPIAPLILLTMGFVFYRLRNLDKVKIDLDDRALELSSDNEKEEGK